MTTTPDAPLGGEVGPLAEPLTAEQEVLDEAAQVMEDLEPIADMDPLDNPRRLLLVHAHPDDETIGTGVTMARYAAEGALVTLVTCTLGEEGEVLVPELAHLAADRDGGLGEHRVGELAAACEALGVKDHRFLGGAGRYVDSGMMGLPSNDRPDCFWRADLDEASAHLVAVIREVRSQVVVTYDENGGYGHPDHVQAHRVAMRAVECARDGSWRPDLGEAWSVAKVYWTAVPRSVLQAGIDALREGGQENFFAVESADELPFAVPDADVTTVVDGALQMEAKLAAMRAHATQIAVDGPFFALSNMVGQQIMGMEYFRLVHGDLGEQRDPDGRENDLFSGVA
jgi:N-acetyl-1-D-myo-inositol-2-amino-2-deoxy-alpha-D-glucopyranoside deacetylase